MEELLGLLFEGLVEVLAELAFGEALGELANFVSDTWTILCEGQEGRVRGNLLTGAGSLAFGAAIGLNTLWLFHDRLIPRTHVFPGVSLLLVPVAAGVAMHLYGNWRRGNGGNPTRLATFWGGALFGFGAALARLLVI